MALGFRKPRSGVALFSLKLEVSKGSPDYSRLEGLPSSFATATVSNLLVCYSASSALPKLQHANKGPSRLELVRSRQRLSSCLLEVSGKASKSVHAKRKRECYSLEEEGRKEAHTHSHSLNRAARKGLRTSAPPCFCRLCKTRGKRGDNRGEPKQRAEDRTRSSLGKQDGPRQARRAASAR